MARDRPIIAYEVSDWQDMPLTTAGVDRDWMEATSHRFAYRCLPLAIANQAGWLIANPVAFSATWDGGPTVNNLHIRFGADEPPAPVAAGYVNVFTFGGPVPEVKKDPRILSHFGSGILTFTMPYLFRTPAGINLWVKGPTNFIKDGVQALEGIVETDWSPATFTMNWKLTRPGYPVKFEQGEPICMVVPVARGLAESLQPLQTSIDNEPELNREYQDWQSSRRQFNLDLMFQEPQAVKLGWQRDYLKGLTPSGAPAPQHQTRLSLREFQVVKDWQKLTTDQDAMTRE